MLSEKRPQRLTAVCQVISVPGTPTDSPLVTAVGDASGLCVAGSMNSAGVASRLVMAITAVSEARVRRTPSPMPVSPRRCAWCFLSGSAGMDASLNPALAEAGFCPRCGQPAEVDFPRRIACPHCGYEAYYNPKPVASVIPRDGDGRTILLRRGFDPGAGLWTFPGGFVELGESVPGAARREVREELGIDVELGALVGVYSRPRDRVVLIVYLARTLGVPHTTPEAVEVRAFEPGALPWDELAFWSTELALRDARAVGSDNR
jgi:8-oxo-dGTP diphosphatase